MEKKWTERTAEEKREARFQRWRSPQGIDFINPAAEKRYKEKVNRLIDAITLKEPDKVPVIALAGHIPTHYSGYSVKEVMYDAQKAIKAWEKYWHAFDFDVLPSAANVSCGRALELLDSKIYRWPGHGASDDSGLQYIESDYLKEDEWDLLQRDPADFQLRTYLPRLYGAAAALKRLPPLGSIGNSASSLAAFSDPEVLAAFKALGTAGETDGAWQKMMSDLDRKGMASGLPLFYGGPTSVNAPLDHIGAFLRGTKGTVMDMFRQPEKLIEYMESAVPETIQRGVAWSDATRIPVLFIPLHRGADGFMSEVQFRTFYWPYLKEVILGCIQEGLVPWLFAEGGFNSRLEIIQELPKGKVIWYFDHTDMARAKEVLGKTACIMGNVPTSLLVTGSTNEVKKCCRHLIETAGKNGGYILAPGGAADNAKAENINAMLEAAKEYGVYRQSR